MVEDLGPRRHELWAHFRFAVVGPLLAAPAERGRLHEVIAELSRTKWKHPITGKPACFAESSIERWYYLAKRARSDPVGRLRRKVRKDSGEHRLLTQKLREALLALYEGHKRWSYQLHWDNLVALAALDPKLGRVPSYSVIRRFMKASGLIKVRRPSSRETEGTRRAEARLESREVRSFEMEHVNALWHLDFHHGSLKVLLPSGEWVTPLLLGILDDRSRLACHLQWYLGEGAEELVHGLSQAYQKRGLPRSNLMDNGAAMIAAETVEGHGRLSIVHETTLEYSPYQNAKQEVFWAQVEGRLLAMLEGVRDLTLQILNDATQAWYELEYNRKVHDETGQTPVDRYLAGPDLGRPCPSAAEIRLAFTREEVRTQRRSDGTISLEGRRFEIPSRYRHLTQVGVRFARWDLTTVHLVELRRGDVLCRIYPLDKAKNSDGRRRTLTPVMNAASGSDDTTKPSAGIAPLLKKLMAEYAATGLPPAYIPKDDVPTPAVNSDEDPINAGPEETP